MSITQFSLKDHRVQCTDLTEGVKSGFPNELDSVRKRQINQAQIL